MADKKKGKKKEKKESDGQDEIQKISLEEENAQLRIQIQSLQDRVSLMESQLSKTKDDGTVIRKGLEEQKEQQEDIIAHLIRESSQRDQELTALQKEKAEMLLAREKLEVSHRNGLAEQKAVFDREREALQAEIGRRQARLDELEDFARQKEGMERELKQLKDMIVREQDAHEQQLFAMEAQMIESRKQVDKQVKEEVDKLQKIMLQATDARLETRTRLALKENAQLSWELEEHSKGTAKLIDENAHLLSENKDLKRQVDLLEGAQSELVKKSAAQNATIKSLNSRIKAMEGELSEVTQHVDRDAEKRVQQAAATTREVQDRLAKYERTCDELRRSAEQYRQELAQERTQRQKLLGVQNETAGFLLASIQDVKKQLWESSSGGGGGSKLGGDGDWMPSDGLPMSLTRLSPEQRETVLRYVLAKLHAFQVAQSVAAEGFVYPQQQQQVMSEKGMLDKPPMFPPIRSVSAERQMPRTTSPPKRKGS